MDFLFQTVTETFSSKEWTSELDLPWVISALLGRMSVPKMKAYVNIIWCFLGDYGTILGN